jgi:hypothetical protein
MRFRDPNFREPKNMKTIAFEPGSPYDGRGWALAPLSEDDRILDLKYLSDLGGDLGTSPNRQGPIVEDLVYCMMLEAHAYMRSVGNVHLGICAGRQFCDPTPVSGSEFRDMKRLERLMFDGLEGLLPSRCYFDTPYNHFR